MSTFKLLDRPIAFHRCFVDLTGSVNAALMLSQAVYWSKKVKEMRGREDGFFYKTAADWTEETGLSVDEQATARKHLRKHTFWQEKKKGIPCKLWYRVGEEKLMVSLESCFGKTPKQGLENKEPNTETTTETTSTPSPAEGGGEPNE
jgi:hypothetical protein